MIGVDPFEVVRILRNVAEDVLAGSDLPAAEVVADARRHIPGAIRLLEALLEEGAHWRVTADTVAMAAVAMAAEERGCSLWEHLPLPPR